MPLGSPEGNNPGQLNLFRIAYRPPTKPADRLSIHQRLTRRDNNNNADPSPFSLLLLSWEKSIHRSIETCRTTIVPSHALWHTRLAYISHTRTHTNIHSKKKKRQSTAFGKFETGSLEKRGINRDNNVTQLMDKYNTK